MNGMAHSMATLEIPADERQNGQLDWLQVVQLVSKCGEQSGEAIQLAVLRALLTVGTAEHFIAHGDCLMQVRPTNIPKTHMYRSFELSRLTQALKDHSDQARREGQTITCLAIVDQDCKQRCLALPHPLIIFPCIKDGLQLSCISALCHATL